MYIQAEKPANDQIRFGYTFVDVDYFPVGYSGNKQLGYSVELTQPRLCLNGFELVEGAGYFLEVATESAQVLVPLQEDARLSVNPVVLRILPLEVNIKTQVSVLGASVACPATKVEPRVFMEQVIE